MIFTEFYDNQNLSIIIKKYLLTNLDHRGLSTIFFIHRYRYKYDHIIVSNFLR